MNIVRFLSILCTVLVTQNLWAPPKKISSAEKPAEEQQSYPLCHFAPNIEQHITELLEREQDAIIGAQYRMGLPSITFALAAASGRPVRVELAVDAKCPAQDYARLNFLTQAGIPIWVSRTDGSGRHRIKYETMHHKFFILENNQGTPLVVTGSHNLTDNGNASWNNVVIINDPLVIDRFKQEFANLIRHSNPHNQPARALNAPVQATPAGGAAAAQAVTPCFFSPGIHAHIEELVRREGKSIRSAQFEFTLYNLAQELALKHLRGVRVETVIHQGFIRGESPYFKQKHTNALRLLAQVGASVRCVNKQRNPSNAYEQMHHKFWLFGGKILVTGSWNATGQAEKNWENAVVITDGPTIRKFIAEYVAIRKNSRELTEAELRTSGGGDSDFVKRMNQLPPHHNTSLEDCIEDELALCDEIVSEENCRDILEAASSMGQCILSPMKIAVHPHDGIVRTYWLSAQPTPKETIEE